MVASTQGVGQQASCGLQDASAGAVSTTIEKALKENVTGVTGGPLRAKTFLREGGAVVERGQRDCAILLVTYLSKIAALRSTCSHEHEPGGSAQ